MLLAKKRYVGFKYESRDQTVPEFDAKGIETVRRDGTPGEQKIEDRGFESSQAIFSGGGYPGLHSGSASYRSQAEEMAWVSPGRDHEGDDGESQWHVCTCFSYVVFEALMTDRVSVGVLSAGINSTVC